MATRTALMLVTRAGVSPGLLENAIAHAHRDHEQLHVVIPAVIPPALPAAIAAFAQLQARGRIDVVPSRDVRLSTVIAETDRDAALRAAGVFSELLEACRRTLGPMSFRSRDQARALPETGRGLPRPGHAVAPYAAIAVAAGVFVLGHALSLRSALALAAAAVLAGAVAAGWTWAQRLRLRDMADRFIAAGEGTAPSAAVLEQRRAELVSRRERRTLAAAVRRSITSTQPAPRTSAQVPVHRSAVQAERARLERVAALLADTDTPVPARGVARTHVLVTNPTSPLYRGAAGELHRQLIQTLLELERGE